MSEHPADALGEYKDYHGRETWIKDLDQKTPNYPIARIWSHTTKRWRAKRERIYLNRVRLFAPD